MLIIEFLQDQILCSHYFNIYSLFEQYALAYIPGIGDKNVFVPSSLFIDTENSQSLSVCVCLYVCVGKREREIFSSWYLLLHMFLGSYLTENSERKMSGYHLV